MSARHDQHPEVDVIAEAAAQAVAIDRDVFVIDAEKWAVHGRIAYDGQVIVATFPSEREAWAALSRLPATAEDKREVER
jgi:predicted DNA-binding WGR domain protein